MAWARPGAGIRLTRWIGLCHYHFLFATNPAVAIVTAADLNGNQIPDWWEAVFFGGYVNAAEDYDGDGLNNLYDSSATRTRSFDSDNDMILDPDEDRMGDGMPNILEQKYSSDPQNPEPTMIISRMVRN
jgi:hypothetical protein